MTLALGHVIYGLAVLVVCIGFLLQGGFSPALFSLFIGGGWILAVMFSPRRWMFNLGVLMVVVLLLFAGLGQVTIWWLLLSLILTLIGDELLRFQFRYKDLDVPATMITSHFIQTILVGGAALVLSGLALSFQLSLAFWPVLGLGIVSLLAIIIMLRRLRKTEEH